MTAPRGVGDVIFAVSVDIAAAWQFGRWKYTLGISWLLNLGVNDLLAVILLAHIDLCRPPKSRCARCLTRCAAIMTTLRLGVRFLKWAYGSAAGWLPAAYSCLPKVGARSLSLAT